MTGTERFEVPRVLGTGASGLVQEVRDRKRGGTVALKRLHRDGAVDVVRLREEFRSLSNVLPPTWCASTSCWWRETRPCSPWTW